MKGLRPRHEYERPSRGSGDPERADREATFERNMEILRLWREDKFTHEELAEKFGLSRERILSILNSLRVTDWSHTEHVTTRGEMLYLQEQRIRELWEKGKNGREIAREVGVTPQRVSQIRKEIGLGVAPRRCSMCGTMIHPANNAVAKCPSCTQASTGNRTGLVTRNYLLRTIKQLLLLIADLSERGLLLEEDADDVGLKITVRAAVEAVNWAEDRHEKWRELVARLRSDPNLPQVAKRK